jgi:hypothetical protein
MYRVHAICRRPFVFLALVLTLSFASAGVAQAAGGFGAIRRFGGPGHGAGQLNEEAERWHIIGVDSATNDVFELEERQAPTENEKERETRYFRLQEFSEEGSALAERDFEYKSRTSGANEYESESVEGIAVDPEEERLYFLVNEVRADEVRDEEETVAASLYAFDTTPVGGKLEFAPGTEKGVLAGPKTLEPSSNVPEKPLLEPHGITVDPTTHEVIIVAHVGTCEEPAETECEDELEFDHYAAQRITDTGALGARFVDSTNSLKPPPWMGRKCEEEPGEYLPPQSPVVTGSGLNEKVLAGLQHVAPVACGSTVESALAQFPSSFTETAATVRFLPDTGGVEGDLEEEGEEEENIGGTIAVSPEGDLYGLTAIRNEEIESSTVQALGVFERSAETLAPIGWTGGQQPTTSNGTDKCVLEPGIDSGGHIQLAVGKDEKIFVLVPEYLREPVVGSFPSKDAIIEFGPGGEGCPKASAAEIAVAVDGKQKVTTPIPTNEVATLSSFVKQGDALSVEWKIEDEATHVTVTKGQTTDQYQDPTLQYTFTAEGEYKVTEEIKTDNLDTPKLTVMRTLKVEEKKEPPEITKEPGNEEVPAGETAKFTAAAKGKPAPSPQWWVSTGKGAEFKKDEGAVTGDKGTLGNTLEVAATKAKSGYEYYVEYTNSGGKAESKHVTLTVETKPPEIASQPTSTTVTEGESAAFTASATGEPTPTAQWEVSTNGGSSWTEIAGATSSTLTVSGTTTTESGYQYRAKFDSEAGSKTTNAATLTVNARIVPPPPPPPPPAGKQGETGVLHSKTVSPDATIASASTLTVSSAGAVSIKVSCPAGATTCSGTVTLRTLTAVSARADAAKRKKKSILTLATGSFSVGGGQTQTVTLHLSAPARALLAHAHVLQARATVAAHDPAGETGTTVKILTLHPAKPKRKH